MILSRGTLSVNAGLKNIMLHRQLAMCLLFKVYNGKTSGFLTPTLRANYTT